jgi:hypothetical protein
MQEIQKQKSHNVNIVSFNSQDRKPVQSVLTKLSKQYQQNKQFFEFLGDLIGALSLFALLFIGLFFVGVFQ